MKTWLILNVTFFLLLIQTKGLSQIRPSKNDIPANKATKHFGEEISIFGKVYDERHSDKDSLTMIALDGNFPNEMLMIIIRDDDKSLFQQAQKFDLSGKKVIVRGKVLNINNRPQIALSDPTQLMVFTTAVAQGRDYH